MSIEGSVSIVGLVSGLWDCTAPQAKYICRLEGNLAALRTAMDKLKELRNDTMRKVIIAEGQQMKRLEQVQGWLSRVEVMEVEVQKLISDASQEIDKKCLGGCFPKNCKRSYKLGKTVVQKLKEVADLKSKGNFEVVADEQPLALVRKKPSEPTVGLELTFDEVWSYIENEQVGIIGVYGIGGVGKTTLLIEINNKSSNTTHRFDVVIWVVVSNNPNFLKVQEDIGKQIGLIQNDRWKNNSEEEKSLDIFNVLSTKRFILLLDDIWVRFNLLKMGIPLPNAQNKSKVVFTTRSEDVCGRMEAQRKIKVKSLAREEAWDLFRKKVGEEAINCHPEIPELAVIVARECGGLPLALVTIGRAMACKRTPREWRHAILMLKKSTAEFSGMGDEIYPRLKFSYDNLQSDIVKSCFLYCSLFPEDYSISKSELIDYWIGEGFLDGFDDLSEARNWGHDIIGTLIHACLLEEDSSSDEVKMHDVIRDMALWITRECGKVKNKVLVQARGGLTKAPDVQKWNGIERMSLMRNDIEELIETPVCPNLLTLLINNNSLKVIAPGFFQNMPMLRVLDLSSNRGLKELPAEISELVSLQHLDLSRTGLRELPIELKKLIELKYLSLSWTKKLYLIPSGVISSFKKLQVLKLSGCGSSNLFGEDDGFESLVKEVECLKELNDLTISITTNSAFSRFVSSPKFQSCTTELALNAFRGSKCLDLSFLQTMRCLDLSFSQTMRCLDLSFLQTMTFMDLENVIVERGREGMGNSEIISHPCFHNLREVYILNCPKLKEPSWLVFVPNLEHLWISNCEKMEEIIGGGDGKWGDEGGYVNLFLKLKSLRLSFLPQLKSIYPEALPFPCLKYFTVYKCRNLKKLPLNSDSAKGCGLVIEGDDRDWWNNLEWEDEATPNAFLPSFKPLR